LEESMERDIKFACRCGRHYRIRENGETELPRLLVTEETEYCSTELVNEQPEDLAENVAPQQPKPEPSVEKCDDCGVEVLVEDPPDWRCHSVMILCEDCGNKRKQGSS